MQTAEIVDKLLRKITGGNKVACEIEPSVIEQFVNDAFLECRPWFDDWDVLKTFPVVATQSPDQGSEEYVERGYVDLSLETPPVKKVRGVMAVVSDRTYTWNLTRDLLALPASPLETQGVVEKAYWEMTWPMVREVLGHNTRFKYVLESRRLYVDDVRDGYVTLVFVREPQSVEDITFSKALQWIVLMAEALTQEALANVRGKFRSGALRFETDASELLSNARARQDMLREQLKDLHFRPGIR